MRVDNPYPNPTVTEGTATEAVQVKRYLRALKRRWPVVVVVVFVGAILGWLTTPGATASNLTKPGRFYRATHVLLADTNQMTSANGQSTLSGSNLQQAAFLATTGDVPNRVAERLQVAPEEVTANVHGRALDGVSSLAISAVGVTADSAVDLANTTAEELQKSLGESAQKRYEGQRDEVLKRLDALKATRSDLEKQIASDPKQAQVLQAQLDSVINQYRLTYEQLQQLAAQPSPSAGLHTLESAYPVEIGTEEYTAERVDNLAGPEEGRSAAQTATTVAGKKSTTSDGGSQAGPIARAGAGAVLGLLLGLGLVFLLDKYDTRLRRREEVEGATLLPVLTEIPPLSRSQQHSFEVLAHDAPRSRLAEAYRIVRTALLFAKSGQRPNGSEAANERPTSHVVMVTSASPDEGKTTSVANLAAIFAEGGENVLVVNCDFRRPRIQRYLARFQETSSAQPMEQVDVTHGTVSLLRSGVPRVDLVVGLGEKDEHANPLEIVALQQDVVHWARELYDIILLDTAPFLTTNDASELLSDSDAVLLVVRSGRTKREAAARTAELLRRLEADVLGVIFTASNDSPAAEYYYQYYLDEQGKRRKGSLAETTPATGTGSNGNGNGNASGLKPVDVTGPVDSGS